MGRDSRVIERKEKIMDHARVFRVKGASREFIGFLREKSEDAKYALDGAGNYRSYCTWYAHEHDMKLSSERHPNETVSLYGSGSNGTEIWRKVYRDGKIVQHVFPSHSVARYAGVAIFSR